MFQDRYKSEPVEDEKYFLTVLRYIHQNPAKANLVENIDEYKYSSYNEYIDEKSGLVDVGYALEMMGKEEFIEFNNEKNDDVCLEIEDISFRMSDKDASEIIKKISKCENTTEFQLIEQKQRDKYIKKLKQKGLSIRQISRLTGVSFAIVRKI